MQSRTPKTLPLTLAGLVAMAACSASKSTVIDSDDDAAATTATTGPGGMGAGGAPATTGMGGGFLSVGGGTSSAQGCTGDLKGVTDFEGNVIKTCPPDQGCFEGACVPACDAAAGSKGSIGCEYWSPTPAFYLNEQPTSTFHGSCFAVFVANSWDRPAKLEVRYQGQSFDVTSFGRIPSGVASQTSYGPVPATGLPPGEVAVLFLSHLQTALHPIGAALTCPVTPAVEIDTAPHNSARASAFEILSDTPITAYDIIPYGGAPSFLPSASLLYPRTAWGDNFVVAAPKLSGSGQGWMQLVAQQDATQVTLVAKNALPAGANVPAAAANATTTVTLNAGEVIQWLGGNPAGSVIKANKPIGAWTGNTYLRVPSQTSPSAGGQDSAHQQIPHVSALGSRYVGTNIVTRRANLQPESVVYQIAGTVDGTTLTYDPAPPAGAPAQIAAGQTVEFESAAIFSVQSQDEDHPFIFSQYMPGTVGLDRPGCSATAPFPAASCGLGDEEWVMQLPPAQFLQNYVFFVDPTYATTNIVITRVKGSGGFEDVTIGCQGQAVTGWMPVGNGGEFEVATVDLFRGGVGNPKACETSKHTATSKGAFGITVWGTDFFASYGYPAGGNLGSINNVVVPPTPN